MRVYNTREQLTQSVFSFLYNDAPDVEYNSTPIFKMRDGAEAVMKKRRPREDEIDLYYFMQTWGSTSMGFGNMGGASMTSAYTTVIVFERRAYIYFGGNFCYSCDFDEVFREVLGTFRIPAVFDQKFKQFNNIETRYK